MVNEQGTVVDLSQNHHASTQQKKNDKEEEEKKKLSEIIEKSNRLLLTLKTVFPFDPFPTQVAINEEEIVVNEGFFFFSSQVRRIPLTQIHDITLTLGVLFAKLSLEGEKGEEILGVNMLKKKEAEEARRVIAGLIKGQEEGIDLTAVSPGELKEKTERIGRIKGLQIT